MKLILIIGTIVLPIAMLYLKHKNKKNELLFNVLAVLSAIIFGIISSTSIYQIIIDDAVFMTAIHSVFLNPMFLLTGAYLGLYLIYLLLIYTLQERKHT